MTVRSALLVVSVLSVPAGIARVTPRPATVHDARGLLSVADCVRCHRAAREPARREATLLSAHAALLCSDCHEPHGNTSNLRLIREQIATPNSGLRDVVFVRRTGPGSFADGDSTYDGVCEVCHTTTRSHRNDPSGDHGHHAGGDCAACHDHWNEWACIERTWYRDADGDGAGTPAITAVGCAQPSGFVMSSTDCDDGNAAVFGGAPEINDGVDNQCPGDPGHGFVDEMSGDCGFWDASNPDEFSCPPQTNATLYEMARDTSAEFASGDCITLELAVSSWSDPEQPPEQACFHYLCRAVAPYLGSWGRSDAPPVREVVCP